MVFRRLLIGLLVAALVLPVAISVLVGVGRLLAAMNDAAGAQFVDRLALGGGVLWIVVLVCLLLVQVLHSLERPEE